MASVYEIKIVSYRVNLDPQKIEEIIEESLISLSKENKIKVSATQVG